MQDKLHDDIQEVLKQSLEEPMFLKGADCFFGENVLYYYKVCSKDKKYDYLAVNWSLGFTGMR